MRNKTEFDKKKYLETFQTTLVLVVTNTERYKAFLRAICEQRRKLVPETYYFLTELRLAGSADALINFEKGIKPRPRQ